jgi:ABC-type transport auxiliary lipoprotein component
VPLCPADRVVLSPWPRILAIDYQVLVDVIRFDGGIGNEVVLVARWTIASADGKELIIQQSRFQAAAEAKDYEATVTAMSRTLEALSREITATLLILRVPRGPLAQLPQRFHKGQVRFPLPRVLDTSPPRRPSPAPSGQPGQSHLDHRRLPDPCFPTDEGELAGALRRLLAPRRLAGRGGLLQGATPQPP